MSLVNCYLSRDALQTAVGDETFAHEAEWDRAILAASRQIDLWTGRHFWRTPIATPRLFRADGLYCVCACKDSGPLDFADPDDVIVETDDANDGTWIEWDPADWQAEPFNPINGWPYTSITTTGRQRTFPVGGRRPRVRITTRWGWAEQPGDAAQACEYLATQFFRAKDQYGTAIGIGNETEELTADPIKIAMKLMEPYAIEGGLLYKPPVCC